MREAPDEIPVLVIDDEADQASINTGGNRVPPPEEEEDEPFPVEAREDVDPSRINGLIRELLTTFHRASYVAYTATPFANVLIDPEAQDRHVEGDLYPRDFILPLPKPPHYVGAERLFGRQAFGGEDDGHEGLDVIRIIPEADVESLVPPRGRGAAAGFHPVMCGSLERAIADYILAAAAKEYRLGPGPATMLIHTTQRTALHNDLRPLVEERLHELKRLWKYAPEESRPLFRQQWEEDFCPATRAINADLEVPFEEVEPLLNRFFNDLPAVTVLNMTSDDVLDFDAQPELAAIVIGGNRLSRGLTLEHLLVSYYVRRATTYDTLLQMGRWFGYRNDYVDLTRLWTTEELHDLFRHLSLVEEEFREQLEIYERNGLTPLDFGPRIRAHPGMAVTAARKMGTAREVQLSFAGQLRQTSRFHLQDPEWLRSNLDVTRGFLARLKAPNVSGVDQPEWADVGWQVVVDYLRAYQSAHGPDTFDPATLADYIREQATRHGELVRWRVGVRGRAQLDANLGTEDLSIEGWDGVNLISRSQLEKDRGSIGVLTNPARQRVSSGRAMRRLDSQLNRSNARERTTRQDASADWVQRCGWSAIRRKACCWSIRSAVTLAHARAARPESICSRTRTQRAT